MSEFLDMFKSLSKAGLAILFAFFVSGILLLMVGYDPISAYSALFSSSVGSIRSVSNTLIQTSPLLFTGIAVAIAFKGKMLNVGAEGQYIAGGVTATYLGVILRDVNPIILIPTILILSGLAGALWILVPALLKVKLGVSEIITTIMFNYIAIHTMGWLVRGPLKDQGQTAPQSERIVENAFLPNLLPGTRLHIGIFIAVFLAIIAFVFLYKTYYGYEIRSVGFSPLASKVAGVKVGRTAVLTMLISGFLAGMGGSVELLGVAHRLYEGFDSGVGYTAIAVAILANCNPLGVILSAWFFGILQTGAGAMQRLAGISMVFVNIIQGIVIIFVVAANVEKTQQDKLGYRIKRWLSKKDKTISQEVD